MELSKILLGFKIKAYKTVESELRIPRRESSPFPIPQSREYSNDDKGQNAHNSHNAWTFQHESRFRTIAQATSQSGQHGKTKIAFKFYDLAHGRLVRQW